MLLKIYPNQEVQDKYKMLFLILFLNTSTLLLPKSSLSVSLIIVYFTIEGNFAWIFVDD